VNRIRQLALEWQQRAVDDATIARRHETVRDELRIAAHTRRNCAWELLRILNTLEKENPSEDGPSAGNLP
jgi:hypothetical protein